MKKTGILASFLFVLLLVGCVENAIPGAKDCRVVLEAGEGFSCSDHVQAISRGRDDTFYRKPLDGNEITGSDYELPVYSMPEACVALDACFREKLCIPILSEAENSLWSGVRLYTTDNHLSAEGGDIHTKRMIPLIRSHMETDGLEDYDG